MVPFPTSTSLLASLHRLERDEFLWYDWVLLVSIFFPSTVILGSEINLSRTAPETKSPMRVLRICWFCLGILCIRQIGILVRDWERSCFISFYACKKVTFTPITATYTHLRSELDLLFFWIVFSSLLTPLEKADIGRCQSQQTHSVAKSKTSASQKTTKTLPRWKGNATIMVGRKVSFHEYLMTQLCLIFL